MQKQQMTLKNDIHSHQTCHKMLTGNLFWHHVEESKSHNVQYTPPFNPIPNKWNFHVWRFWFVSFYSSMTEFTVTLHIVVFSKA